MLSMSCERLFLVFNLRFHLQFADICLSVNSYLWKSLFKNSFEYKALTVNRYFVVLFTALLVMDLARISGMKVEKLKNFLRLRGLRTYEEVDLSPQNSFQSPECAVYRSDGYSSSCKEAKTLREISYYNVCVTSFDNIFITFYVKLPNFQNHETYFRLHFEVQ